MQPPTSTAVAIVPDATEMTIATPVLKGPVRSVLWFHNAIMKETRNFAETARGLGGPNSGDVTGALGRFRFFRRVLELHDESEDRDIFPVLEARYDHVADTYEFDHRRQRALYADIESTLQALSAPDQNGRDALVDALRRQALAFATAMELHVAKENELLYPLYDQTFSAEAQTAMSMRAMQENPPPPDLMAQMVPWMFRLQSPEDRADVARFYLATFPPERRSSLVQLLSGGVKPDEWSQVVQRVPELAES